MAQKARSHYRYVVLRFVEDLTDPNTSSVPVAVVGVVHADGAHEAVFLVAPADPTRLVPPTDKLSRNILSGLGQTLRSEIDRLLAEEGSENLFSSLRSRLVGSIQQGAIQEEDFEVDLAQKNMLLIQTLEKFSRLLGDEPKKNRKGRGLFEGKTSAPATSSPEFFFHPVSSHSRRAGAAM